MDEFGGTASIEPILAPNAAAMLIHLEHLFGDSLVGKIELTWSHPETGKLTQSFWYETNQFEDLINKACELNRVQGQNVYIGAALRKPGTLPVGRGDAKDHYQTTAFYVDLDDAGVADNARPLLEHCKPTLVIITGRRPHTRAQLWWRLEDPEMDAQRHIDQCKALAAHFHGDNSVHNPDRVMRLGGSVAWPRKSGRVLEMTEVIEFTDRPLRILPGQMERAYPFTTLAMAPQVQPERGLISGTLDTGSLISGITSGSEWHNRVIRLVANMVNRNISDQEMLAMAEHLTLPGYTAQQTRQEMQTAINGARAKWNIPNPIIEVNETTAPRRKVNIIGLDDIRQLQPPSYVVDEIVTEYGFTLVYGQPGCFKSFLSLDWLLCMAHGRPWAGKEVLPKNVLYIAGEGVGGVGKRVAAWELENGLQGVSAPFYMLERGINFTKIEDIAELINACQELKELTGINFEIICVDTVARAMVGSDEKDSTDMGIFIDACDTLRHEFHCGVIAVHHCGKNKELGSRGSNALPAACDTEIFVDRSEGSDLMSMKIKKQKDDEEGPERWFKSVKIDLPGPGIKPLSSLVLRSTDAATAAMETAEDVQTGKLSVQQVNEILRECDRAWLAGDPWSSFIQAKNTGRYLPKWMSENYAVKAGEAKSYLESWLSGGKLLRVEDLGDRAHRKGLKVVQFINN